MAYSNPTIDAISRGGAVANQGMSVANSMLQGVMHAMDSTSDMAFRLDKLLRDEQARKIEQGLKTQQFIENQYQFDITSQLNRDTLEAQKKQWGTANSLANKKYELAKKKYDIESEKWGIEKPMLKAKAKLINDAMNQSAVPFTLGIEKPTPATEESYKARKEIIEDSLISKADELFSAYDNKQITKEQLDMGLSQIDNVYDKSDTVTANVMGAEFDTDMAQYQDEVRTETLRRLRNKEGLYKGLKVPFGQTGDIKKLEAYEDARTNAAENANKLIDKISPTKTIKDKFNKEQTVMNPVYANIVAPSLGITPKALQEMFNGNISTAANQNMSFVENEIGYKKEGGLVPDDKNGFVIDYNKVSRSANIPKPVKLNLFSKGFQDFGTMSNTQRSQFTKGIKENPEYSAIAMAKEFTKPNNNMSETLTNMRNYSPDMYNQFMKNATDYAISTNNRGLKTVLERTRASQSAINALSKKGYKFSLDSINEPALKGVIAGLDGDAIQNALSASTTSDIVTSTIMQYIDPKDWNNIVPKVQEVATEDVAITGYPVMADIERMRSDIDTGILAYNRTQNYNFSLLTNTQKINRDNVAKALKENPALEFLYGNQNVEGRIAELGKAYRDMKVVEQRHGFGGLKYASKKDVEKAKNRYLKASKDLFADLKKDKTSYKIWLDKQVQLITALNESSANNPMVYVDVAGKPITRQQIMDALFFTNTHRIVGSM